MSKHRKFCPSSGHLVSRALRCPLHLGANGGLAAQCTKAITWNPLQDEFVVDFRKKIFLLLQNPLCSNDDTDVFRVYVKVVQCMVVCGGNRAKKDRMPKDLPGFSSEGGFNERCFASSASRWFLVSFVKDFVPPHTNPGQASDVEIETAITASPQNQGHYFPKDLIWDIIEIGECSTSHFLFCLFVWNLGSFFFLKKDFSFFQRIPWLPWKNRTKGFFRHC